MGAGSGPGGGRGLSLLALGAQQETPRSRGGGGAALTAVGLVTVVLAVVVPVTDEGWVCADASRALKLSWAALELVCGRAGGRFRIRRGVLGVAAPTRAPGRPPAPPSPAGALTAVGRLIRVVPAVILRVALPPEGDALVVLAHKLEGRRARGVGGGLGNLEVFFEGLGRLTGEAGSGYFGERTSWVEGWDGMSAGRPGEGVSVWRPGLGVLVREGQG